MEERSESQETCELIFREGTLTLDQQYWFIRGEVDHAMDELEMFDPQLDDPEHKQELEFRVNMLSTVLESIYRLKDLEK